ncbi:MAG: SPASM domain-containing protein [Candidatus Wallbacteria bacterium]|nr:SPASM domain-containing protein [Candidatus Wallbacteria bacterium]
MKIPSFQIGITDHCNLKCIHCGQNACEGYGHPGGLGPLPFHQGKKGFMDEGLFRRIMDDIEKNEINFDVFNFFWFGEQFLHPLTLKFLRQIFDQYRRKPFFHKFFLHTNGTLFNQDFGSLILDFCREFPDLMFRLYFSLDAGGREDFFNIKRSDDYELVERNIVDFIKKRQNFGIQPQVVLGFIVLPENRSAAGNFLSHWQQVFADLGREVTVTVNSPHETADCLYLRVAYLPLQAKFERLFQETAVELGLMSPKVLLTEGIERQTVMQLIDGKTLKSVSPVRPACPAPFRTVTVNWDGRLAACCSDYEFEVKLPSLTEMNLTDAWLSAVYQDLRCSQLSGDLSAYPRCEHCGNIDALPLSKAEIELAIQNGMLQDPKKKGP